MIVQPFNDVECLGPITERIAQMVEDREPVLVELAERHPTTRSFVAYLRSLPQRDDLGDPHDGPRVYECQPSQRLRIDNRSPNCVERAATAIGVQELRFPHRRYQLATVDTPLGLHTFPLFDGKPVVLDPRVTDECVECGLALSTPGLVAIAPRNAIAWTADMASAGAAELRNAGGPSTIYIARNAIRRLVDHGAVPAEAEIDAIGLLVALAERVAHRYGRRALELVRVTARAIADVLDAVLSRRNVSIDIAGYHLDTPKWLDDGATAVGKVGLDLGSLYLRSKLGAIGVVPEVIGLLESHLGEQNRTLGAVAHPPDLVTFQKFASPRTA